jgi:hypothetical protein
VGAERNGEKFAEHSVGGFRSGGDDEDVARLAEFDRGVKHEIVAGMGRDGDRGAGDAGVGINRAEIGPHQAFAALRFVDGGDAEFAKHSGDGGIRSRDIANNAWFHEK